jgi:hypothetical protein
MVRSVRPAAVPWQLAAETCRGNLISIIKAYITLEHLLVILHRKKLNPYVGSLYKAGQSFV